MRVYLNSGHDIETAMQMMAAIESSGGMDGISVTVSGPQPPAKGTPVKWEGISLINNIAYSEKGMQVWKAYEVGSGKVLPWGNFAQQNASLPQLNKMADNGNSNASFVAVIARRMAEKHQENHGDASNMSPEESDDDDNCDNERKLFFCPEYGCVKSYQRYYSLEQHLCLGRHKYALEHETLYDKAMALYATNLEHGAGVISDVIDDVRVSLDAGSSLPMGWALKSSTGTRKKLTVAREKLSHGGL